jgi:hypothetical protein
VHQGMTYQSLVLPRCPYMMSPTQQHTQEKQTRDGKTEIQTFHTALYLHFLDDQK